jgi:hypothetical protein
MCGQDPVTLIGSDGSALSQLEQSSAEPVYDRGLECLVSSG